MRFDVLTLFPELISTHMDFSIMKRASEEGIIEVVTHNPRDYTLDKHKKVDDTPYGGGAGMVLMPQPYVDCYEAVGVNKGGNNSEKCAYSVKRHRGGMRSVARRDTSAHPKTFRHGSNHRLRLPYQPKSVGIRHLHIYRRET